MLGPFKPTSPTLGGLLWKIPWRLSAPQKARQRKRLQHVDRVVSVLDSALQQQRRSAQHPLSPLQAQVAPLTSSTHSTIQSRRQGRGPKQGEILAPDSDQSDASQDARGIRLVADQARELGTIKLIERWKAEMPTEDQMLARDKYTIFDRKARGYRKGIHKLPKWTRISQRINPPGF